MAKRPGKIRIEYYLSESHDAGVFLKRCAEVLDMSESMICRAISMAILGGLYQQTDGAKNDEAVRQAAIELLLRSKPPSQNASSSSSLEVSSSSDEEGLAAIRNALEMDEDDE